MLLLRLGRPVGILVNRTQAKQANFFNKSYICSRETPYSSNECWINKFWSVSINDHSPNLIRFVYFFIFFSLRYYQNEHVVPSQKKEKYTNNIFCRIRLQYIYFIGFFPSLWVHTKNWIGNIIQRFVLIKQWIFDLQPNKMFLY